MKQHLTTLCLRTLFVFISFLKKQERTSTIDSKSIKNNKNLKKGKHQ